jgi:putative membrane protein
MDWLSGLYPWLKALHIVSVIAWMAGLLYLPRLFVYHADAKVGSEQSETFKIMERRLLRGIMNPAMGAAYIFGILTLLTPAKRLVPRQGRADHRPDDLPPRSCPLAQGIRR